MCVLHAAGSWFVRAADRGQGDLGALRVRQQAHGPPQMRYTSPRAVPDRPFRAGLRRCSSVGRGPSERDRRTGHRVDVRPQDAGGRQATLHSRGSFGDDRPRRVAARPPRDSSARVSATSSKERSGGRSSRHSVPSNSRPSLAGEVRATRPGQSSSPAACGRRSAPPGTSCPYVRRAPLRRKRSDRRATCVGLGRGDGAQPAVLQV